MRLKAIFATTLTVLALLCVPTDAFAKPGAERLVDYLKYTAQRRHIPATSAAVVKHGTISFAAGVGTGDLEHNVGASASTVYHIASLTKPFTALGILVLVREGRLQLDDPVTKFIPEIGRGYEAVTIRHLLTHTSGVTPNVPADYWVSEPAKKTNHSKEEILGVLARTPLVFPPGEKCQYSNIGFFLLGVVIERVSGERFRDYLNQHIFKVAGMKITDVVTHQDLIRNRAPGYDWDGSKFRNADYIGLQHHFANGGMVSNVVDLANWMRLLTAGKLTDRATLLQMWTPARLNGPKPAVIAYDLLQHPLYAGMGWIVGEYRGKRLVTHRGDIPGYSAVLLYFPDDEIGVIVLCNRDTSDDSRHNAETIGFGLADRVVRDLAPLSLAQQAFLSYLERNYGRSGELYRAAIAAGDRRGVTLYNAASVAALRGDRDAAFEYLEAARVSGFEAFRQAAQDPDLLSLHGDPRWRELMRRISGQDK